MKALLLSLLLFGFFYVNSQDVGPPKNVGREYGNPKMPLMVSHLAGANKERLKRANKNSRHSIFGKILCFRKVCRIQSGHSASLRPISFKKFKKKVARNAKKGLYKKAQSDSSYKSKPVLREAKPVGIDTVSARPAPAIQADSLIVLGAELLFETNKSTLGSEHLATLKPIVDYLVSHPARSVKISGHTDNTGNEGHNLTLSKRRAEVVAEYLIRNGVDSSRVETFGIGSAKPLAVNTSEEGRKKNRRVELLISQGR
jgi:outer membrane protein OmpA-like peptidoglycan-associated protein